MATTERRMTLEQFLALPEEKPALEFEPDGTVAQKMPPKPRHSATQTQLVEVINAFARPRRLARAYTELRAVFAGAAYVPDVSVYRWERIQRDAKGRLADEFTEPPDIAIEVVSPGQPVNALVRRSLWYVEHEVGIALVVDPEDESVLVFRGGQQVRAYHAEDAIDLEDVLPGLGLTANRIFESLRVD